MVKPRIIMFVIPPGKLPKLRDRLMHVAKKPAIKDMKKPVYFSSENALYAYTSPDGAERYAKRLGRSAKYVLV
jgi:hypothetical protein